MSTYSDHLFRLNEAEQQSMKTLKKEVYASKPKFIEHRNDQADYDAQIKKATGSDPNKTKDKIKLKDEPYNYNPLYGGVAGKNVDIYNDENEKLLKKSKGQYELNPKYMIRHEIRHHQQYKLAEKLFKKGAVQKLLKKNREYMKGLKNDTPDNSKIYHTYLSNPMENDADKYALGDTSFDRLYKITTRMMDDDSNPDNFKADYKETEKMRDQQEKLGKRKVSKK